MIDSEYLTLIVRRGGLNSIQNAFERSPYEGLELILSQEFSVLIVEDDDDARRNMEDILSLDDYKIRSVSHCLPAITAIQQDNFDAVIVDWKLPDENADQLIPLVNEHQPCAPVVVVTGVQDIQAAITALRSGVYDFLQKPINPDVFRAVVRRIVERKEHLAAIESAHEKLLMNERLAAIGEMVTGLAHESRNALQRSHACLAELELDVEQMPPSLELVQKIRKALDDVQQLLEEVRNYSAPIILERRECCLESGIKETWQEIRQANPAAGSTELILDTSENFPSNCFFDCRRIQQVIRNLLENAIHANSREGKVYVRLILKEEREPLVRVEVEDEGSGIAETQRERIFSPFVTTKTKGTGLGLAVARRLVEAHDGRIFAENSETGGARMVLELPYTQRQPARAESQVEA